MSVTPLVPGRGIGGRHRLAGGSAAGRSPRALVLDDDPAFGRLMGHIAKPLGFIVDCVTDAAAFQVRYRGEVPDLVILDLQIGDTDGVAQMHFLRDQRFRGSVLLVSGFDARVLGVAARLGHDMGLDIVAALQKPLRAEAVVKLLTGIRTRAASFSAVDVFGAIEDGELFLEYQPVVVRQPRSVLQVEALVRWQHPERGRIPPDQFISAAEDEPEVIDALTRWVVSTAAAQHRRLVELGVPVMIAVNISGRNLDKLDFPDQIASLLLASDFPAEHLCLELTETAASRDLVRTMDVLSRLRLKGVSLAIDDFGIGYSSLTALRQLPFSTLKIDRSFVADILTSRDAFIIVKSIADLARNMELSCIAEGVETEEVAAALETLGVTALQGYLIARPLAADALGDWLRKWRATAEPDSGAQPARA